MATAPNRRMVGFIKKYNRVLDRGTVSFDDVTKGEVKFRSKSVMSRRKDLLKGRMVTFDVIRFNNRYEAVNVLLEDRGDLVRHVSMGDIRESIDTEFDAISLSLSPSEDQLQTRSHHTSQAMLSVEETAFPIPDSENILLVEEDSQFSAMNVSQMRRSAH